MIIRVDTEFRALAHAVALAEGKTLSQMFRELIQLKLQDSKEAQLHSAR